MQLTLTPYDWLYRPSDFMCLSLKVTNDHNMENCQRLPDAQGLRTRRCDI